MAFDYMHPPEDFEYLGEWCKAWRDPATGDWTISQLLDGLDTAQIILSGEEVRELARLAAQHDPTDYRFLFWRESLVIFSVADESPPLVFGCLCSVRLCFRCSFPRFRNSIRRTIACGAFPSSSV